MGEYNVEESSHLIARLSSHRVRYIYTGASMAASQHTVQRESTSNSQQACPRGSTARWSMTVLSTHSPSLSSSATPLISRSYLNAMLNVSS